MINIRAVIFVWYRGHRTSVCKDVGCTDSISYLTVTYFGDWLLGVAWKWHSNFTFSITDWAGFLRTMDTHTATILCVHASRSFCMGCKDVAPNHWQNSKQSNLLLYLSSTKLEVSHPLLIYSQWDNPMNIKIFQTKDGLLLKVKET